MTGYIKMIDIWMIFTISYPFVVITLHCLDRMVTERGTRRINVESSGKKGNLIPSTKKTIKLCTKTFFFVSHTIV